MSSAFRHRFILTGDPGSGKGTIIGTIIKRGFWCSKGARRGVIQDQVNISGDALPWANRTAFIELMLSREMCSWHEAEGHTQPCFLDHGVPDIVDYLRLSELTVPKHLENAIEKFHHNRIVFIAPPWREMYVQDTERKQSFDVTIVTCHTMVKIYRTYNYQLIELPCVSTEERVDFILSRIKPC